MNILETRKKAEQTIKNIICADGGAVESVNLLGGFLFVTVPEISKPQIKRFFETGEAKKMFKNIEFKEDLEKATITMSAETLSRGRK